MRMLRKWWRLATAKFRRPIKLIDDPLWQRATQHYAFMRGLTTEENRRLRLIASDFLARKRIVGAAGVEITPIMQVEIAAQACILVLELGVDSYDDWQDIIVYPGKFRPKREIVDTAGVVHMRDDTLAGEAWLGGPVVLSYEDVARTGSANAVAGFNVVIHEFAHKLDMRNGDANGFPPLHKGMSHDTWQRTFKAAYLQFCEAVDNAEHSAHHDGGVALDTLPIDPYASESPAEFFAVMSEAFFELPDVVHGEFPAVYDQLLLFYRQHPLARLHTR
jgi:MtfA peptidase